MKLKLGMMLSLLPCLHMLFATARNIFPTRGLAIHKKNNLMGMSGFPSRPNTAMLPDANAKTDPPRIHAVMVAVAGVFAI